MADMTFRELNPTNFLERSAAVYADRQAVVDEGGFSCTYAELWQRTQRMAGMLIELGVGPGDRVVVLAPNTHMLLEAHYGVSMAGAVLVALNTRLAAPEFTYILDHSQARVALVDGDFVEVMHEAVGKADHPVEVITNQRYEQLLAQAEPTRLEVTDERGLLSINYTSGTTGQPKGVMYHHRGAYLQALAMAHHAKLGLDSRYLWTLPMFHTNGWCFPWAVTAAGSVHYCLRKVSGENIWNAIHDDGITHMCGAPTVLTMMAGLAEVKKPDHSVRVFAGGAPPWPALLAKLTDLGIDIQHLYGLTETYGGAVICEIQPEWREVPLGERAKLIARQGVINVVGEPLRVIDNLGQDVPADGQTQGEICMRGNNVMLGYYRDDEATAKATTEDGWFRSGDIGVRHPDSYVELRDRLKDIIISGGENISSIEVENAITDNPEVIEAAVVGEPDEKWGEVPVAFVVLRPGSQVSGEQIIEEVRGKLAHFKAPRRVYFGQLPKTSTGKIRKNVLRAHGSEES